MQDTIVITLTLTLEVILTINNTPLHRNCSIVLPFKADNTAVQFAYSIQLRQPTQHSSQLSCRMVQEEKSKSSVTWQMVTYLPGVRVPQLCYDALKRQLLSLHERSESIYKQRGALFEITFFCDVTQWRTPKYYQFNSVCPLTSCNSLKASFNTVLRLTPSYPKLSTHTR